jgi:hypothetical protein
LAAFGLSIADAPSGSSTTTSDNIEVKARGRIQGWISDALTSLLIALTFPLGWCIPCHRTMNVRLLPATPSLFLASRCILVLVSMVVLGVSIVPVSVVPGVPVVHAFSIVSAVLVAPPAMIIVAI